MATALSEMVEKTARVMGKVIKKPPMKPKLLQKPPFRFLFDVVSELTKTHGLFAGLFTPDELDAERVKEKAGKLHFLTKVIKATALTCGDDIKAKPTKIVAGQEPENTNKWLQAMAKCVIKKMDSTAAVQQVVNEENDESAPPPQTVEPEAEHQPTTEAPAPPRPADDRGRRGKRPGKAGQSARGGRPPPGEAEAPGGAPEPEPIAQSEPVGDEGGDAEGGPPFDHDRAAPSQRPVSRGRRTSSDTDGRTSRQDRPSSARRGQRRPQPDSEFGNPEMGFDDQRAEGEHEDGGVPHQHAPEEASMADLENADTERATNATGRSRRPRPATSRRMKPSGVEEASADEPVEVAGLMADGDDDDDAADDDTFVMVEAPEQTAPRRTPIERDDDTDAVHGSLMRTIQQKKGTATAAENESSVSEVAKLKQREVVSEEVNGLREAIQQLCRSANPLGKIVDYIQEDCDSMQTEVAQWNEEHRINLTKIASESATTESELQQGRLKLEDINRQIDDQQEMIHAMKSSTFENDARIQRLLGGISFSAKV